MITAVNKTIFFTLPIILFFFLFLGKGLALDEGGCLICHQYPGLVRLDEKNNLKALHIDEAKYFNSSHGKLRCKQCHTTIEKIPHTGETTVDCTSECHKGNKGDKEKKIPDNYPLKGFHKNEQSFISSLQDESSCRVCHPLYPHHENHLVRGFLNLHAGFMFCEVCHIKKDKFENLTYNWENSEKANFVGTPFGTYFNPLTKKAAKNEHFISRIAVFSGKKDEKKLLTNTWDTALAKEFIKKENNMQLDKKKEALKKFHSDVEKKEISVACNQCHSENSILDYNQLGFDEKKTADLIYLNIKGLVTKYKTFYLPNLFPH